MNEGVIKLDPIDAVIADVRLGKPIVMVDDVDRENEGDLMVAAECVTEESIALMIREGRGLICISLTPERLKELQLPLQVVENTSPFGTNFAVSFDHRDVAADSVTAKSRAFSIKAAVDSQTKPSDLVTPGVIFPVCSVPGGVLRRRGQTEGSVDLARLAGLKPAGVICEIMAADGTMLRGAALQQYCEEHDLKITSVEAIVAYRLEHEVSLRRVAGTSLSGATQIARSDELKKIFSAPDAPKCEVVIYVDDVDGEEQLALVIGTPGKEPLVRIHSECLTGDVFGSRRCDCGVQFEQSLRKMCEAGNGVLIYLHQEGRGIGLGNKLRTYELQDCGRDTVDANLELGFAVDARSYRAAAHVLRDLGIDSVRLITNNPDKVSSLIGYGIKVSERIQISVEVDEFNRSYLEAKRDRLGHQL